MPPSFDCVLINGTVVNHDGIGVRDIGVRDGRIAEIGALGRAAAGERIDCRGLHILPGVIDSQVHFREPGLVHKEDLETGSRAAVLGGVTAVFEMPNTDPTTTSAEALADKLARAKGRMHCDFAFWVGGTHDNVADLPELERLPGAAGIKVFMGSSTGRLLVADDEGVLAILKQIRRRAAFHSEDEARLNERKALRVAGDPVVASRLARRDRRPALDRAPHSAGAPGAGAGACSAHLDPRGDGVSGERQGCRELRGDAASSDAERRGLPAPRDEDADEPAGARARASRRDLARASGRASSTCSAPTMRPIRWKRRPSPIRRARRA